MDLAATQVYEDEDFVFTQKISLALEEEESVQIGTLNIDSTEYQIKKGITKIGRLPACDIVIKEPTVSKLHAEIEASTGQESTWICDLNSCNKTILNNFILRPNRSYELKDGSVIEFGKVRATYRIYRPADIMIPETPAPRQKTVNTIIPNTPDSSLNNSSAVDDDGSIILGTQKDDENVFRRPRIPRQCQSPNSSKNNISKNESSDSQNSITLHMSDGSENQISMYDVETQKIDKGYKTASNSIYDMETQKDIDVSENIIDANAKVGKQLQNLNVCDETAGISVTDIHDIETQNCIVDINEMETQKSNIQKSRTTGKKSTTDIYTMETQKYADNNEDGSDTRKLKIDKNNSREKSLVKIGLNVHDLETQTLDNKYVVDDISDLETQLELDNIARCEENKDVSDMETQFEADDMANEISNDRTNKEKDENGVTDTTKEGINHENITRSPRSRSSSPGSLNLSSPGVEGDPPSSLNQSDHLLESSDLLEFFSEGIDKQEVQAFNMSTPKPKEPSKRNNNVENVQNVNDEENNDEDIFEAPTQNVSRKFEALMDDSKTDKKDAVVMSKSSKKHEKSETEQTNDDSETDAEEYITELAEKQHKSSRILNKPSNEDVSRNDPGTSIESEDMFDVQTQRLDNPTTKDTSNLSINQPQISNEINKDDGVTSIPVINNDQTSTSTPNIDDAAPTQLLLSRETSLINSVDLASKNNQNDADDMVNKQIFNAKSVDSCITEDLDREDIDYELAPTQVIGEIEAKKKGNSTCEKDSFQKNLNDTLEQKLNEIFADVNNDMNSIHESPLMSTQNLENILESSECDNYTNKSIADSRDTDSVPQKQTGKKNQASCNQFSDNLLDVEVNVSDINNAKTDSQNSDVYFSTIITRRKRNILRDTQELVDSVESTIPGQNVNFSQNSKANNRKAVDNNIDVEYNKREKIISKIKNKSDAKTKTLNDNDRNKIVSSENNERNLQSPKMKQKNELVSETSKQVLENDPAKLKVDDVEENASVCTPCPSEDGQRAQILDTLCESDDDILTRLPAVRISGTLSNPASPSASSTSTVRSTRSKQDIAKNKRKKVTSLKGKSLRKRDIENSQENNKPSVDSHSNFVPDNSTIDKIGLVDTSDDSDNESKYKRFQQMADRMLSNESSCRKQQKKESRKSTRVSSDSEDPADPKQSMDVESKNLARTNLRTTRRSNKRSQQDESSHDLQKETLVNNTVYGTAGFTEPKAKSIAKRKTLLNVMEKSAEQVTPKKRKTTQVTEESPVSTRSRRSTMKTATDKQFPNILEYFTKTRSRKNFSENMNSSDDNKTISKTILEETQKISLNMRTDGNVDPERTNVKRTRRAIYDSQSGTNNVTANENSKKSKPVETKETEAQASQLQDKILKIVLTPVKNFTDDESQEVEQIMAKGLSNTQDKNLSIRDSNKAKIFQRELRTRRKKRHDLDTETDSVLTESGMSSEMEDSDNMQFDNSAPKAKRGRLAKSSVSSEAQVSTKKKEIFKKPTRINQNSTNSILDSSTENMIGESSQSSTESDASTSSRLSRKAANIKKNEKMKSNQNIRRFIDESASRLNTSVETSLVLTPSRTRRSTSILNNSTSSAMRHNVLFTGIMKDYSKIVKMLGGSKVEDPAKCTILVTDKVRRTYKFLCALARGIPIVTIDWLTESETAERFLDWENYILKDPAAEAKFGFRLRKSLDKAKEKKLLDGYIVVLTPSIAPPPVEELKDIVSSCGGKALLRPPAKWPERAMVLSREDDLPNARKFLAKAPATVTVQSTEFILTGILRQETDFVKYKLIY